MRKLLTLALLLLAPVAAVAQTDSLIAIYPRGVPVPPRPSNFRNLSGLIRNAKDFGAAGDGVTDETTALQAGITSLYNTSKGGLRGGVLYLPCGRYRISRTLQFPPAVNDQAIVLRGESERCVQLSFVGATTNYTPAPVVPALVLFGTATPDNAGAGNSVTQYVGIENVQIDGGGLTGSGSVRGLQFTEAQSCWAENVLVKSLPNSSTGIYLRGSTVTGGLAASTRPETRECHFVNLMTDASIGSGANARPSAIIFQNADENNFYDCIFGVTPGLTSVGNDSIFIVNFQLGRQNRFYGVLIAGDVTSNKTQYVGEVFGPPKGEDGSNQGSVLQNQTYGDWLEGLDIGLWNRADGSGNTTGNTIWMPNLAIYNTFFKDDNDQFRNGLGGALSFTVFQPGMQPPDGPIVYFGGIPAPYSAPMVYVSNVGATPEVSGANLFFFQDASPNTVTNFLHPKPGQVFTVCATTANTTIANGGNLLLQGGANVTLPVNGCMSFVYDGRITFNRIEISRTFATTPQQTTALTCGSATTPALNAGTGNSFTCNITSNVAVTVAVPTNPPAAGHTQQITVALRNTSGGALTTAPTFNAGANGFKFTGSCNPGNGTQCVWEFQWDPVQSFWYMVGAAPSGL
jgi:hypothetical protein